MDFKKLYVPVIKPFIRYTSGQTLLNCAMNYFSNGNNLEDAIQDAGKNLLFFSLVNGVYTSIVNYLVNKFPDNRWLVTNAFSLSVSGAFYVYALITNDNDPLVPSLATGITGLVLTNIHVSDLEKELEKTIEN